MRFDKNILTTHLVFKKTLILAFLKSSHENQITDTGFPRIVFSL